jgi:hypothetical protein
MCPPDFFEEMELSMNREYLKWRVLPVLVLSASLFSHVPKAGGETAKDPKQAGLGTSMSWQSHAKLHHLVREEHGDIAMGAEGIEFRSGKGRTIKLPFLEIQTFSLSSHSLDIQTYKNRNGHLPGMQHYTFDLDQAVPPEVAAGLAREVRRPSQNVIPDPAAPSIRNVFAHHRTRTGGTNGTLRFREDGIDYVTSVAGDNRSWRWNDLQTLSEPDPYHLFVFGYRDTYTFDLKEPLPQALFNRLTDEVASSNVAGFGQMP